MTHMSTRKGRRGVKYLVVILVAVAMAGLACGGAAGEKSATTSVTGPTSAPTSSEAAVTSESATTTISSPTTATANGSAATHNTWTALSPPGALPTVRAGHVMVVDPSSHRVIMFGGLDQTSEDRVAMNDTWAYDPASNTWTDLKPSGELPPVRAAASMVYDSSAKRAIMFGGEASGELLSGTWAYDPAANTWTGLNPSGDLPAQRAGQGMVYDSDTGKVILFGGIAADGDFSDTWSYDPIANAWTYLSPTGTVPSARDSVSMVYDPSTHRVLMFGGLDAGGALNDTWAYDPTANTWTKLSPSGTLPPARYAASIVYDTSNGQTIMFGGQSDDGNSLNDTWAYDPTTNTWTKLSPSGEPPSARSSSMVYDSVTGQAILFGGNGGGSGFNDTWSYRP